MAVREGKKGARRHPAPPALALRPPAEPMAGGHGGGCVPRPHFRYLSPPPGAAQPGAGEGYCVPELGGLLPPGAARAGRPAGPRHREGGCGWGTRRRWPQPGRLCLRAEGTRGAARGQPPAGLGGSRARGGGAGRFWCCRWRGLPSPVCSPCALPCCTPRPASRGGELLARRCCGCRELRDKRGPALSGAGVEAGGSVRGCADTAGAGEQSGWLELEGSVFGRTWFRRPLQGCRTPADFPVSISH